MLVGLVKKVHGKQGTSAKGPYTKWSMCIEDYNGQEIWVSNKFTKPADAKGKEVEEGHRVRFELTETKYGKEVAGPIEISTKPPQEVRPGPTQGAAGAQRQTSIVVQSARKDALAFVQLAVDLDAVPVTKGKTVGDRVKRFAELEALVDKFTVRYTLDVQPEIDEDEFRVFGVVSDSFGEATTAPLPAEADEAPADNAEPAENPENTEEDF